MLYQLFYKTIPEENEKMYAENLNTSFKSFKYIKFKWITVVFESINYHYTFRIDLHGKVAISKLLT